MKSTQEIRDMLVTCRDWFAAGDDEMNAAILSDMIADLDAVVDYGVGNKPEAKE